MRLLPLTLCLTLLAACGDSNQDRLSDDLATAEQGSGIDQDGSGNYAEDVNQVAAASVPAAPAANADLTVDDEADRSDPLSPLPETPIRPKPAPVEAPASAQPSFDCGLATTDVEEWICDQPGLASADRAMATAYRRALGAADAGRGSLLRRTAENFLRYRNRCPDPDCVAQAYTGRMREIADIMRR